MKPLTVICITNHFFIRMSVWEELFIFIEKLKHRDKLMHIFDSEIKYFQ